MTAMTCAGEPLHLTAQVVVFANEFASRWVYKPAFGLRPRLHEESSHDPSSHNPADWTSPKATITASGVPPIVVPEGAVSADSSCA